MGEKDKKFKNTNDFTRNETAFSNDFDDILRELEDELAQKNKGEERNTTEQPKTTEQLQITEENAIEKGSRSSLSDFEMLDEFDFEKIEPATEQLQTNIENPNENGGRPSLFDPDILEDLGYVEKKPATEETQINIVEEEPKNVTKNDDNNIEWGVTYVTNITEKKYGDIYYNNRGKLSGLISKFKSLFITKDTTKENTEKEEK